MLLLDEIIKKMLEEHKGGKAFFDHLDAEVQRESIMKELLDIIGRRFTHCKVICSGKFGIFLNNLAGYMKPWFAGNMLLVPGGLRCGGTVDLEYVKDLINGWKFVFIDDSFYSGKTRDIIKAEIERLGGNLVTTYVIYDGSKVKDYTVNSLYRYYN
jgi:hypothetical protein